VPGTPRGMGVGGWRRSPVITPQVVDKQKSRDMASLSCNPGRSCIMVLVVIWRSYMRMKKKFFIHIDILICTHIPCVIIRIAV
jgi:hypothetical protein